MRWKQPYILTFEYLFETGGKKTIEQRLKRKVSVLITTNRIAKKIDKDEVKDK